MEVKLELTAENINEYIKNALLESSVGINLRKLIDEEIRDKIIDRWDNPFKKAIEKEIVKIMQEMIRSPECVDMINKGIAKYLTADAVSTIIYYGLEQLRIKYEDIKNGID